LTLMASCYLQVDKVKFSSLAIEVLDYADDKKSTNLDLRLQAMLAANKEIRVIVQYLAKFFSVIWNKTADAKILKSFADEVRKKMDFHHKQIINFISFFYSVPAAFGGQEEAN